MSVDIIQASLMAFNAFAAVGCTWGYYREHARRTDLAEQNRLLRVEHTLAAHELVSLRKTNKSLHDHAERMGQRAKAFAIELRGSDGTAKTCVWPNAKPEVWQR